jgi:predicted nucleic acid-binding protein
MARLIDSSLWVDFTRAKSPIALKSFIHPWILDSAAVLCEPVAFEVLRHATKAERTKIHQQFSTLPLLATPVKLWRDATTLGAKCHEKGINPGSLDLLLASIAIHHDAELITFDNDFSKITSVSALKVTVLKRPIV